MHAHIHTQHAHATCTCMYPCTPRTHTDTHIGTHTNIHIFTLHHTRKQTRRHSSKSWHRSPRLSYGCCTAHAHARTGRFVPSRPSSRVSFTSDTNALMRNSTSRVSVRAWPMAVEVEAPWRSPHACMHLSVLLVSQVLAYLFFAVINIKLVYHLKIPEFLQVVTVSFHLSQWTQEFQRRHVQLDLQ